MKKLIFAAMVASVLILASCGADYGMMAPMAPRLYDPFDEVPELMRRWIAENMAEPVIEEPFEIFIVDNDFGFTEVLPFENGLAWASAGGRWGLVDGFGNIVVPIEYDAFDNYRDYIWYGQRLIILKREGSWGIIDINRNIIIPFEYEAVYGIGEGIITVRKDGKVGFIDMNNNVLIPPKYDNAGIFAGGAVWVQLGARFGAVNIYDEIVVSIRYTEFVHHNAETFVMKDQNRYVVFDIEGFWTTFYDYDFAQVSPCGLIIVEQNGRAGVIDSRGNTILPIVYDEIFDIRNDLIFAVRNGMATVLNRWGDNVIPNVFDDAFYSNGLIYVSQLGRVGVMDTLGRPVIPIRYDLIMEFGPNENVTWFMRSWEENRWGIIDRFGNIIMEPRYYNVRGFSEGLAMVNFGDYWGYVNERGQGVISDQFDQIPGMGQFARNVALVSQDGLYGFIDRAGSFLTPVLFEAAHEFGQNILAWAQLDGRWVILKLVIPELVLIYEGVNFVTDLAFEFLSVGPFTYGFSIVRTIAGFGVVNAEGRFLIPAVYDMIFFDPDLDNEHFLVRRQERYGYITISGEIILEAEYDSIQPVQSGFIASLSGRYGHINRSGYVSIPFEYDEIVSLSENLLAARIGNRWGFVDTDGINITEFIYDSISEIEHGLIKVSRNRRYGFIDERGEVVIPLLYDQVRLAGDSFIIVREGIGMGVIDVSGNVLWPPDFTHVEFFGETSLVLANEEGHFIVVEETVVEIDSDEIMVLNDRIAIARKGSRFGVINAHGDILVPIGLDRATSISEDLLLLHFDGRYGLMNKEGHILLMPVYNFVLKISERILAVAEGNMFGLINSAGERIFMQELSSTWVYNDNLSVWLRYTNELEAAGNQGEIILDAIAFVYDKAVGTPDTMYKVTKEGRFGFVDINGDVLLPIVYDANWTFNEELSLWIRYDRGWHLTGRHGESLLYPEEFFQDFFFGEGGIHQVMRNGRVGYINIFGEIVIPIIFDEIVYSDTGLAIARIGREFGFINYDGTFLTPIIYNNVTEFMDDVAWVGKDGRWGIIRLVQP